MDPMKVTASERMTKDEMERSLDNMSLGDLLRDAHRSEDGMAAFALSPNPDLEGAVGLVIAIIGREAVARQLRCMQCSERAADESDDAAALAGMSSKVH